MKVGDLVRLKPNNYNSQYNIVGANEATWLGVVTGWDGGQPIVWWNESFQNEREYPDQLEIVQEVSNK